MSSGDARPVVLRELLLMAPVLQRLVAEGLQRRHLTQPRIRVLTTLADEGPSTMSAIARALEVTPRAVTALVDALAEAELVERTRPPEDRRATIVALTPKGRRTVRDLRRGYARLAERLLGDVADADLDAALRVLGAVRNDLG
jgi:DNA-binding MarR family transcriptional regulator